MRLASVRDLLGITPVLMEPAAAGPDPDYMVIGAMTKEKWENLTVITTGKYGKEYPKTFGHYHRLNVPETYHVIDGIGILQLQKKHFDQKMWVAEMVDEVFLVTVHPGEEVVIEWEYGHSWSNVGTTPLLSYDNWRSGHEPTEYAMIERLQGMAYYLIEENGKLKAIANPKYQNLPEPVWVNADEFKKLRPKD